MKKYLIIYAIINAKSLEKNTLTNKEIEATTFKKAFEEALRLKNSIKIWYESNIEKNNDTYISIIDILNIRKK